MNPAIGHPQIVERIGTLRLPDGAQVGGYRVFDDVALGQVLDVLVLLDAPGWDDPSAVKLCTQASRIVENLESSELVVIVACRTADEHDSMARDEGDIWHAVGGLTTA